jgi:aminoglycoside 3'-phosphotransferase II
VPLSLPPDLRRLLPAARWEQVAAEQEVQTWQSQKYTVKVQPHGAALGLQAEGARLRWLAGRLPAPQMVGYATDDQCEYLATTRLPGLPMNHPDALLHARRGAALLARALRELHALPIRECPFTLTLAVRLRLAREYAQRGAVDMSTLAELVRARPEHEDLVVTHGAAHLRNVLVAGDYAEGLTGLGRLGIADRHVNLALSLGELRTLDGGEALAQSFLETYGPERVDAGRLAYYGALGALF